MKKGFSMIESLIGTALMLLVFVSIFGVFNMGIKLVGATKAKAGAIALATEQMEMMRNFSYTDVGTVGGVVPGLALQSEIITLNGVTYTRRVDVRYVDDPKGGDLFLSSLTSAEGLKFPDRIGGDLDLADLASAGGLKLPDYVGGNIYLGGLTSADKEKIQEKYPHLEID